MFSIENCWVLPSEVYDQRVRLKIKIQPCPLHHTHAVFFRVSITLFVITRLSWVKDFQIGIAKKKEKSWQIYITCAQNQVPFVDFIQDSNPNDKTLPPPRLFRGRPSGDKICPEMQDHLFPGETLGILNHSYREHYAATCYLLREQKLRGLSRSHVPVQTS